MNFWTKEEYKKFADEMMDKPVSYYAFEMLYWCGIREGELLALTAGDFDFEKGTVTISKSYQRLHGEDVITTPETRKSNRTIKMPQFLCEEMQDYIGMLYGYKKKDRIFPISKNYLHREMDRGSRAAGVKRIRIHDLRHSHISLLIDMGFSAVAIADRVGHESIEITYRYAHLFPSKQTEMSNKLIIAAAGSGKTTHLVNEALKITEGKVLITTYTEANEQEIVKKFYKLNGCIPENVTIQTWFSFLIQHGVKPYQNVIYNGKVKGLLLVNKKSAIRFIKRNGQPVYFGEDDPQNYYFSKSQLIYSDKLSKFVVKANELTDGRVLKRIGKIYSHIFIDEIQDMAGYDLEIIKLLFSLDSNVLLVGDPRQVTYHTHEEAKYRKYTDGNIKDFVEHECSEFFVDIDETTLNKTYRNNQLICEFANSIYSDFKPCEYVEHEPTGHDGVFFVSPSDVDTYLLTYQPMQLRDTRKTPVNSM